MTLFNLQGSTIFGPGSEWFWSMAQFLLVAVTLIGIYYQVRTARAANAFEQMDRIASEFEAERMLRHRLEILEALRDGVEPENIPDGAAGYIANFWERVAVLVRGGHVDRKVFYEFLGGACQYWWTILAPNTRRYRIATGDPRNGEHHEWLAGVMDEMNHGTGETYDDAQIVATLERRIRASRELLRAAEEMRAVIVRSVAPAASPDSAQPQTELAAG